MEPDDNRDPWAFTSARTLIHSFQSPCPQGILIDTSIPDPGTYHSKSEVPKSLGDFDRLFAFLGKPLTTLPRRISLDSSSAPHEDKSTPPSSVPDDETIHFEDVVSKAKEVRWTDQEGTADLVEVRRRSTRGSTAGDLDESDTGGSESDTLPALIQSTPRKRDKGKSRRTTSRSSSSTTLLPGSTTPHKLSRLWQPSSLPGLPTNEPNHGKANKKKANLVKKLAKRFRREAKLLKNPKTVIHQGGNVSSDGIHVFVDLSNIVIGFYERIKANRGAHVGYLPFSFHSLALILERGRTVRKRVMVGSTASKDPEDPKLPDHVAEAERLGYEPNILERVPKPLRTTPRKNRSGTGSGYATSGYSSASETQVLGPMAMKEQGVDEILQMKMLESLVDSEPSTIVLASGDAAEAEYSGGFFKTVERALKIGWMVEIAAWSEGLSKEYRSKDLLDRWGDKLSIIELDDFAEEILASYTPRRAQTLLL